ncbi:hypothetical protein VNI00_019433 [Paramarasmius palmivorus]|uniref:F-box domain-containing protein n=1 Tax=Paramarasmius palmivorus TaxID=297713 RepID=A0AAW0ANV5_9AGAR
MAVFGDLSPEVVQRIMRFLETVEVVRLGRTSRWVQAVSRDYFDHYITADKVLSFWFSEAERALVRRFQATTGMIISGSAVLAVLANFAFRPNDLDLYIPVQHCATFMDFLLRCQYSFSPKRGRQGGDPVAALKRTCFDDGIPSYVPAGVLDSFDFTRSPRQNKLGCDRSEGEERSETQRVQVMATEGSPIYAVLNFHSTIVMNIMTYSNIVCFYPRHTLSSKKLILLHTLDVYHQMRLGSENIAHALSKYRNRGFEKHEVSLDAVLSQDSEVGFQVRHGADRFCWTRKLRPVKDWAPDLPILAQLDDVRAHSWRVRYNLHGVYVLDTHPVTTIDRKEYCISDRVKFSAGMTFASQPNVPTPRHSLDVKEAFTVFYRHCNYPDEAESYVSDVFKHLIASDAFAAYREQGFFLPPAYTAMFLFDGLVDMLRKGSSSTWPQISLSLLCNHWRVRLECRFNVESDPDVFEDTDWENVYQPWLSPKTLERLRELGVVVKVVRM